MTGERNEHYEIEKFARTCQIAQTIDIKENTYQNADN